MNHMTDQIQAFLDGELSQREARMLRDHLDGCTACRQEFLDRQELWQRVDTLAAIPFEISIWPKLADRLERRRRHHWSWPNRSLAAAAALAGMLMGWQLGQPAHTHGANDGLATEIGFLEEGAPSLDQLWLQVGINGGPGS